MVVRIRLQRFGRIHAPFYRIVVADSRSPRNGKFIERVGTYDPIADHNNMKNVTLDAQRVKYWLSVGAQPSDRVHKLLAKANLVPAKPQKWHRVPADERPETGFPPVAPAAEEREAVA